MSAQPEPLRITPKQAEKILAESDEPDLVVIDSNGKLHTRATPEQRTQSKLNAKFNSMMIEVSEFTDDVDHLVSSIPKYMREYYKTHLRNNIEKFNQYLKALEQVNG
ncbi:MAG: hypothetical protein HQL74_13220 [Magnetococcales bacterium]|nr:hypothetical protein [Magnetococcales bacterium]